MTTELHPVTNPEIKYTQVISCGQICYALHRTMLISFKSSGGSKISVRGCRQGLGWSHSRVQRWQN